VDPSLGVQQVRGKSFDTYEPDLGSIPKSKADLISGPSGCVHRIGNGWPSPLRRWCTREKVDRLDKHCGDAVRYIGFASDEAQRTQGIKLQEKKYDTLYPLVEGGMDELACLAYCKECGFDWGGLYEHFHRVSCFCCPLQRLSELRTLRKHFPELWDRMLSWEDDMGDHCRGFKDYVTVHDLDKRFFR